MNPKATKFVLDYLRDGPEPLESLFLDAWAWARLTREEIAEAGRRLGIVGKKLDGVVYVMRPHNLVAIWWAKRALAHRFTGAAHGGSAA